MVITQQDRHHLKKFIRELQQFRGRHTEFVTIYVPAGYELSKITTHLAQEQGTATNIKSAATRKNVIDALERILQHLKLFDRTPPNGLAAFAGNVASHEGGNDVRVWSIEPPIPINTRIYRCDKTFQTEILEEMMQDTSCYGLVIVDARDAVLALLKGKAIQTLTATHSHIPGKMKAGGQSALRFSRNRDLAIKDHMKKVAEIMKDQFLPMENLKGIIVGGPGPIKYELIESNFITGDVKSKIIGIKDLSYTGDFGLHELVDKSQDLLASEEIAQEKKLVGQFLEGLATKPNMIAYGVKNVKEALEKGAVETLLVSEELDEQILDELEAIANNYSTHVFIVSTETREGAQLVDIGKVGALLRYAL